MLDSHEEMREGLIRSLKARPRLAESERSLHGRRPREIRAQVREGLELALAAEPFFAAQDERLYLPIDPQAVQVFRLMLDRSLGRPAKLADGEADLLAGLGFEKLGEFRSSLQAQLETPTAIPEENLAIYVPDQGDDQQVLLDKLRGQIDQLDREKQEDETADSGAQLGRSLAAMLAALRSKQEQRSVPMEAAPRSETSEQRQPSSGAGPETLPIGEREEVATTTILPQVEGAGLPRAAAPLGAEQDLSPLSLLTAALEAIGVTGDGFGFILRYGRYAPDGRQSAFLVGGVGLAELSRRLSGWLKARKAQECQVQVVDDGTGELALYLSAQEMGV